VPRYREQLRRTDRSGLRRIGRTREDDVGALMYMPAWVLEDLGLDVSVGDRVEWSVSPLDHDWFDARFEGLASVDLEYQYDDDRVSGVLAGTVISIRAVTKSFTRGTRLYVTAAQTTISTADAEYGRPPAEGFVFEVSPAS
jgi:hypothetical protein